MHARSHGHPQARVGVPRLVLGAALLLWGGVTGRPLLGLLLALVVEAAHWTRVRWDFGPQAFLRAWQASVLMLVVIALLVWLEGSAVAALPQTITWLPVGFMPLQFVQSYGIQRTMSLSNLSLLMRRRRAYAERLGLPFRDIRFSCDSVFLAATLLAAGMGRHASAPIFFPAVGLLIAALLLPRIQPRLAGLSLLVVALACGYAGERGLTWVYENFALGGRHSALANSARQTRTAIGQLGEIKQSPEIRWRLVRERGEFPALLRIAAYNDYRNTFWSTKLPPRVSPEDERTAFKTLESVGLEEPFWITARGVEPELATAPAWPRFRIRGPTPTKDLFPIPGRCGSLVLANQDIEMNAFGTLRLEPRHPVADALVLWGDPLSIDQPPWLGEAGEGRVAPELEVPEDERRGVARVVDELDLRGRPLREQIRRLRQFFIRDFTYTRYLDKPRPGHAEAEGGFVAAFLQDGRRGHCEYFATAAAFLLRECGVPTRYATGFAVVERDADRGEAYLRGTHAHAWCLAWDRERSKWIDVDLTPPTWTGLESGRLAWWQRVLDRWQMLRVDLAVWRSQPGNLGLVLMVVAVPALLGAGWIGRRLWRSRQRLETGAAGGRRVTGAGASPLAELERSARPVLGPRPRQVPLARWLGRLRGELEDPRELDEACALHQQLRYDPRASAEDLQAELQVRVARLRSLLKGRRRPPG